MLRIYQFLNCGLDIEYEHIIVYDRNNSAVIYNGMAGCMPKHINNLKLHSITINNGDFYLNIN